MAVEVAGAQFVNFTNGAGVIAPVPAGLVAGDIWVVAYTNDNQDASGYVTPSGWTVAGSPTFLAVDGQYVNVLYKTATGSEAETSFNSGELGQSGVLVSLRVSGSAGFDALGQASQSSGTNVVPMDGASVTTTQDGDFLLFVGGTDFNNTAAPNFVAPTGFTGLASQGNASFSSLVVASRTAGVAGTYTTSGASATYPTTGTTGATATYILAFKAASSSGPGAQRRPLVLSEAGISELGDSDTLKDVVTAHTGMSGLNLDQHLQYHTQERADLLYKPISHAHAVPDMQQSGALGCQGLRWSGTAWAPEFLPSIGVALVAEQVAAQSGDMTQRNADNLVIGVEPNGVYAIDAFVTFQFSASNVGALVSLITPPGARNMVEIVVSLSTGSASVVRIRTTFPNASSDLNVSTVTGTTSSGTGVNHTARISGIIRNGAQAGDCQIRFASASGAAQAILQPGSAISLWRLA